MPPHTLLVTNWGTVHAALCPEGVCISVSFQVVRTLNACSYLYPLPPSQQSEQTTDALNYRSRACAAIMVLGPHGTTVKREHRLS